MAVPVLGGPEHPDGSGATTAVTAAPGLAGPPSFMAPEQTRTATSRRSCGDWPSAP